MSCARLVAIAAVVTMWACSMCVCAFAADPEPTGITVSATGEANIHLDLATPNFGIQESREFNQAEKDIFPGAPEIRNGYFYVRDVPGWPVLADVLRGG